MRKEVSLILLKIGSVVVQEKLNIAIFENSRFFFEKLEKLRFQVENLGNYGEIWGILVQKYQRGEVIFFVPLKLGTRVGHEKLNIAIFEFYDFAKKKSEKNPIQV